VRGAMPVLRDAGIPAITLSARSMPLMATALKEGWPLFRMAPNDQDETDAIVEFIMGEWIDQPVALLDDGTIYFREMVNAVRNALEERGLQPVLVDTFRPAQEQQLSLVRRLAQAGQTASENRQADRQCAPAGRCPEADTPQPASRVSCDLGAVLRSLNSAPLQKVVCAH